MNRNEKCEDCYHSRDNTKADVCERTRVITAKGDSWEKSEAKFCTYEREPGHACGPEGKFFNSSFKI